APAQRPTGEPPAQPRTDRTTGARPTGQPPAERPGPRTTAHPDSAAEPHLSSQPPGPFDDVVPDAPPAVPSSTVHALNAIELRRIWPAILDRVKSKRRYTWMMLREHAHVVDVSEGRLTLGFSNSGARDSFGARGSIDDLRSALLDEIGVELHIMSVLSDGPPEAAMTQRPASAAPRQQPSAHAPSPQPPPEPEPQISDDDEELVEEDLPLAELLASQLDAEIIHEEPRD
ncbi:MAG: hypothetical protein Q4B08_15505, partial [Propionibacteriaceae bacterium]|nr:hypothetical protein [Propionibacteriaceae bacterium]